MGGQLVARGVADHLLQVGDGAVVPVAGVDLGPGVALVDGARPEARRHPEGQAAAGVALHQLHQGLAVPRLVAAALQPLGDAEQQRGGGPRGGALGAVQGEGPAVVAAGHEEPGQVETGGVGHGRVGALHEQRFIACDRFFPPLEQLQGVGQPQPAVGLDLGAPALETQQAGMGAVGQPQGALAHGQAELVQGGLGRVVRGAGPAQGGVGLLVAVAADEDDHLGGRRQDRKRRWRRRRRRRALSEEPGGEGQQQQAGQNGGSERLTERDGHGRDGSWSVVLSGAERGVPTR